MSTQVFAVLAVAAVGVAMVVYMVTEQIRLRRGDAEHQSRGLRILMMLAAVLFILESGLGRTSFQREPISFWVHMTFALPTFLVLTGLAITGILARKQSSARALRLHRLLNKPAGNGTLLWLSASIATGLVFVAVSLGSGP